MIVIYLSTMQIKTVNYWIDADKIETDLLSQLTMWERVKMVLAVIVGARIVVHGKTVWKIK